jgi:hypothetical protein
MAPNRSRMFQCAWYLAATGVHNMLNSRVHEVTKWYSQVAGGYNTV